MLHPLTRVLLRVVARGFYQQHTGGLLTLLVLVVSNFFWTRVPNQTHLTADQLTQNGFRLVIFSVSEPLGVAVLLGGCFGYSLKSGHYVAGRLQRPDAQFLAYSSTALPWRRQAKSWAVVQGVILLPAVALCLYALVVGLAFHHWLVPALLPLYLLLLVGAGAGYYPRLLSRPAAAEGAGRTGLAWVRRWPKPLCSLFIYEVIASKRLSYFLAKLASAGSITLLLLAFPDARADGRLAGLLGLCCAVGHAILVFQAGEFEAVYLSAMRNLPYGWRQVYGQQVLLCGLLVLPELTWLVAAGPFWAGPEGAGLLLGVVLLLRSLLYRTGQRMATYLRLVVGLFLVLLLANLFGLTGLLALGSALAAGLLLYRYR